jgi:hypothetical protein
LAKRALVAYWNTLDLTNPDKARDALLAFTPQLVAQFGQVAATQAAYWYEEIRAKDVRGRFATRLADTAPADAVQSNVRFFAGHLYDGTAQVMLSGLGGAVQRHVVNASRDTIRSNAARDPARPFYARVPVGKTCAFCLMLASRGFVYASEETAGGEYHNDCDCEAVADFSDNPRLEGYDPDGLYDVYASARDATGSGDAKEIAAAVRRMHPSLVTDGVATGKT